MIFSSVLCSSNILNPTFGSLISQTPFIADTGRKLYTGSIDATVKLWRQSGVTGFYRGLSACTLRDVYAWGLYLLIFEYFRVSVFFVMSYFG